MWKTNNNKKNNYNHDDDDDDHYARIPLAQLICKIIIESEEEGKRLSFCRFVVVVVYNWSRDWNKGEWALILERKRE